MYICICVCMYVCVFVYVCAFLRNKIAAISKFNNLYNAKVEVNETALKCSSLFRLQSPMLNILDLIQNNRKCWTNVITSCDLLG